MKVSRFAGFLLFLASLFSTSSLPASITEEGSGIVYGSQHAFSLKAPKGWVLDNESGADQDIHAAFYPKGGSWSDSPIVAYASSRPITSKVVTADDAAKFAIEDFHMNGSPKYQGKRIKTLKTDKGKEAVIYHFSGDQWNNCEAVVYYVENKTINFIVMTSRDPKIFAESLAAFESLAKSYVFMGDHPLDKAKAKGEKSK